MLYPFIRKNIKEALKVATFGFLKDEELKKEMDCFYSLEGFYPN